MVVNGKRFKVREGVFKIFIGVIVLYNVVLVFAIQQSESAIDIHICPLFWVSFLFRSPHSITWSSLCSANE